MALYVWLAAAFALTLLTIHLISVALAVWRCRPQAQLAASPGAPAVTIIRPVCGLENFCEQTLRSTFALAYPRYDILFCAASGKDPAVPLVRRLIAEHPDQPAVLLIGDERISHNPKLNNVYKGWQAARQDWIVIADSNVLMPPDYVQRLLAAWRHDTGLVCSPPAGCLPSGFWAELECAFLNTYQARWQYCADSLGLGFAQGKSMLWRRAELEGAGGIRALAADVAEDAASTKAVRANGKRVRLVDAPFDQPLGNRTLLEVWRRQLRWARLRRAAFPVYYAAEIFTGGILPALASAVTVSAFNVPALAGMAAYAVVWYGAEAALAQAAGWARASSMPFTGLLRDALLPALWIAGWLGNEVVWRGNQMDVADSSALEAATVPAESGDGAF